MITFELSSQDLAIVNDDGNFKNLPGKVLISIGGSQPDEQTKVMKKTVEGFIMLN